MTRVLIVDRDRSFCRQLRHMLERRRDIRVVGETADGPAGSRMAQEMAPDVLLIELALCPELPLGGLDAAALPPQRMIVTLPAIDKGAVVEAFRFGAQAILPRTAGLPVWRRTIRRVMEGQYCFENGSIAVLVEAFRALFASQPSPSSTDYGLTARELDIIGEVVAGHSNREVGAHFAICERTVKHHLTNIFEKVGVSNRLELALFAVKHQLAPAQPVVRRPAAEEKGIRGRDRSAAVPAGLS